MNADERDRQLVEQCRAGNTAAFGGLVEAYQGLLFNVAYRMVGQWDDAADILQTALLKAYERLETYDPRYKFFSWIYRIVINESLNFRTRQRRTTELNRDLPEPARNPEERAAAREVEEKVQSAVQQLTPDYREVIVLRHFVNMSYREMSRVLEIPEKTVKSRLYTARRRLGEILTREGVTYS